MPSGFLLCLSILRKTDIVEEENLGQQQSVGHKLVNKMCPVLSLKQPIFIGPCPLDLFVSLLFLGCILVA